MQKKSPLYTKYWNLNTLGECDSFPELNEISTGQFHIFFLLLLANKMSSGHLSNQRVFISLSMPSPVKTLLSSHYQTVSSTSWDWNASGVERDRQPNSSLPWPLPSSFNVWPWILIPWWGAREKASRTGWPAFHNEVAGTWHWLHWDWWTKSGSFSCEVVMGFQMSPLLGTPSS